MRSTPETISLFINDVPVDVSAGATVAAAILMSGVTSFRRSVLGEPRDPLCGMGVCFECRVTINGETQRLSCQPECKPGMRVITNDDRQSH